MNKEEKETFLETDDEKVRIGIVGSREYKNISKIRRAIIQFKRRFGDDLVIVSGGCRRGADRIVRDLIETDGECREIEYEEFPPRHQNYNQYCVFPEDEYGKQYDVGHFFERNTEIAERVDYLFAFIPPSVEAKGTMDTVEKTKDRDKKVKIIE